MTASLTCLFHDDFAQGLRTRDPRQRPDAPWSLRPTPSLPDGDGTVRTTDGALIVESSDRDPVDGDPMFMLPPVGEPVHHVRWAAFTQPFDPDGGVLVTEATLSAEVFRPHRHPRAAQAGDGGPGPHPLCGSAALVVIARDAGLALNIALTNEQVWAMYGVIPVGDGRAEFLYAVPLASRTPTTSTAARCPWTPPAPPAGCWTAPRSSPSRNWDSHWTTGTGPSCGPPGLPPRHGPRHSLPAWC